MKTKTLAIVLIFILLLFAANASGIVEEVYAWDDCPKGLVNDEYPGECARYVDTDENGICDHSESAPEDRINSPVPDEETLNFQTESPRESVSNNKDLTKIIVAVLSILVPLVILVGYASIYKIKQGKKS